MKRSAVLLLTAALAAAPTGCVTRRYLITSDPPGAVVYRDGQPIGATPVEEAFTYYGKQRFRIVKDGFQPLDVEPDLCPPFYQYPIIDFVSENLIPYTFRDVKPLHFQLQPLESVRLDDVRARADELRHRGQAIQTPPGTEAAPKIGRPPAPTPAPAANLPAPVPAVTAPPPPPPRPGYVPIPEVP